MTHRRNRPGGTDTPRGSYMLMQRWLRPGPILLFLAIVVAGATVWVLYSTRQPTKPMPLPVAADDREIAWINSATAGATWQRFVEAVVAVTKQKPGPETFPRLTTAVPELAVSIPGVKGKLRFRWYKVTSELKHGYWIEALSRRSPPPLAVIGGNTTDTARTQALELTRHAESLSENDRPLLLLTTATAERVKRSDASTREPEPLIEMYRGRTFRFCFNNRQIGEAVTRFIWDRDELRPDAFPVYFAEWKDDAYSADLINGFLDAVKPIVADGLALGAARDWGLGAGTSAGGGGFPLAALTATEHPAEDALIPWPAYIPWSVGSFDRPNRYEAEAAMDILDHRSRHPRQRRALLILSGQSGPSRRLVRALCRLSPVMTRRFVLASGDAISFNTIARDRNVTWPIQDLPSPLVLFCHTNPVNDQSLEAGEPPRGTEDLLLYQDIVNALIQAATNSGRLCADADALRAGLRRLHVGRDGVTRNEDGPLLFDDAGDRNSGTGEHVVWLRPEIEGGLVLPEATILVSAWKPDRNCWEPRGEPLRIQYTGARRK